MKSSPSIVLALALSATAAMAAAELSATDQRTQNVAADPTLLTLDRIFDSSEFRERGLGEYKWSQRTASYFTLEAPQAGRKERDLVRNNATWNASRALMDASFDPGSGPRDQPTGVCGPRPTACEFEVRVDAPVWI